MEAHTTLAQETWWVSGQRAVATGLGRTQAIRGTQRLSPDGDRGLSNVQGLQNGLHCDLEHSQCGPMATSRETALCGERHGGTECGQSLRHRPSRKQGRLALWPQRRPTLHCFTSPCALSSLGLGVPSSARPLALSLLSLPRPSSCRAQRPPPPAPTALPFCPVAIPVHRLRQPAVLAGPKPPQCLPDLCSRKRGTVLTADGSGYASRHGSLSTQRVQQVHLHEWPQLDIVSCQSPGRLVILNLLCQKYAVVRFILKKFCKLTKPFKGMLNNNKKIDLRKTQLQNGKVRYCLN